MSPDQETSPSEWNFFRKELETILKENLPAKQIYPDLHTIRDLSRIVGIEAEFVRRVDITGRFSVFGESHLELIINVLQLTPDHVVRLQAAMATNAIARMLYERSDDPNFEIKAQKRKNALQSANAIWHILFGAFQNFERSGELIPLRIATGDPASMQQETEGILENAIELLDRASLAMQMTHGMPSLLSRHEYLVQAKDAYHLALNELNGLAQRTQQNQSWQLWHERARQGLEEVVERILFDAYSYS